MLGTSIRFVGEDNPFELECNHAMVRIVGNEESAGGIVQIVRIERTMFCHRAFDPFVLCDQPR